MGAPEQQRIEGAPRDDRRMVELWSRRASSAGAAVTAAALLVIVVTSVLLLEGYRPAPTGVPAAGTAVEAGSRGLVQVHEVALVVAVTAAVWSLSLSALRAAVSRTAGTAVALVAALGTVLLTVVTSLTWFLVEWDQLALWAVMTGTELRGLWRPAFSDEVRFLLVDGAEVAPGTYRAWLLVHLAAPVLALGTVAAGWSAGRRTVSR